MPSPDPILHDVIIAGAGPVGLLLACELRLAGIAVLVLEAADDPHSPLKALPFGLRGLSLPTVEALDRRGLLDDVAAAQRANDEAGATQASAHWLQQKRRPAGHFAGIQFFHDDVDAARWTYRLASPAGATLAVDMQALETILAARAAALGAEIRRGVGVEALVPANDRVILQAGGGTFHARWLIGCDGGRSIVRKAGDFAFTGTDPEFTGYSILADLADPDALPPGRSYTPTGMYTYAKPGTIALVDFDGGAFHRTWPITQEHVQAVLRRVSGTAVTLTALRLAATWTDRARQATAYRRGRVLLAGDAAHIHSPLGGQGLNLGLGDAINLGWKLAATIRGDAPAGLLNSYCKERHAEGARILDWSRAQVALMRPSPGSRALAAIIGDLVATRDGATYFAERMWGVSLRYDLGGSHSLVGRSCPDFRLTDGRRTGVLLRAGRGLLLDFAAQTPLRAVAQGWQGRIDYVAGDAENGLGLRALLLRPDGFVAWASEGDGDLTGAHAAASRWFGRPR
ncbi:FAD-dependent monooxygenase [Sphingomonas crusticola]|uniref:FAD-dependent monooxygenase n=1 Tax=Sphingomonas crusticola TaxID=1697973 RepID=UPI000E278C56|nr:FAD-dependent monooxygenase [Sphingomonas crusticola]